MTIARLHLLFLLHVHFIELKAKYKTNVQLLDDNYQRKTSPIKAVTQQLTHQSVFLQP